MTFTVSAEAKVRDSDWSGLVLGLAKVGGVQSAVQDGDGVGMQWKLPAWFCV